MYTGKNTHYGNSYMKFGFKCIFTVFTCIFRALFSFPVKKLPAPESMYSSSNDSKYVIFRGPPEKYMYQMNHLCLK